MSIGFSAHDRSSKVVAIAIAHFGRLHSPMGFPPIRNSVGPQRHVGVPKRVPLDVFGANLFHPGGGVWATLFSFASRANPSLAASGSISKHSPYGAQRNPGYLR